MTTPKIYFDIITLFPGIFVGPLSESLLSKALRKNLINIEIHNLRTYGTGPHKQVDDRPFGGGPGMVLKPDVLSQALKAVTKEKKLNSKTKPHVIALDPSGKTLNQQRVASLAKKKWLVLISGHYEGLDQRFKDKFVDEEISIGDYVLSGGEIPSLVLIDSISRLVPGFMGKKESAERESFSPVSIGEHRLRLLDYPVYTKPVVFGKTNVPKILLSGDHGRIDLWRKKQSLKLTQLKRPDLLKNT